MVQVIVNTKKGTDRTIDEWVLVEFQGDFASDAAATLANGFVGDLYFTTKDVLVFIIGHHLLYGNIVNMEKPLAVLVKDVRQEIDPQRNVCTQYTAKAIVKKKVLFKSRPKPIIANVSKTR